MSLLSYMFGEDGKPPPDPYWQRDEQGLFFRLLTLRPSRRELARRGGVFVLFHGGLHPGWVYVGSSADLGAAVEQLKDHHDVITLKTRGGLFFTWAYIKADKRNGVVAYLRRKMKPELDPANLDRAFGCDPKGATPEPVQLPG